ncbi:MAG: sodium:proton antiporter [Lachnospiraceae bacterium]|nr:sodium:proton antiporter [Lachnospiraceae bacterium]
MSLSQAYNLLYNGAIMFLAVIMLAVLFRAVKGPEIVDRIVAVNMLGTLTIMIICILAVKLAQGYLLDVAIIYAMISFLAVVILTRIYLGVYLERERRKGEKS